MRHLDQDPGAIAGIGFAAAGAAVSQVVQNGQGLFDDTVGRHTFNIDDETCPAGIMFELRVVETLFGRRPG